MSVTVGVPQFPMASCSSPCSTAVHQWYPPD